MTLSGRTAEEDALGRLKNYDKDEIILDDSDYAKTSTHFPMSFSQEDEDDLFVVLTCLVQMKCLIRR